MFRDADTGRLRWNCGLAILLPTEDAWFAGPIRLRVHQVGFGLRKQIGLPAGNPYRPELASGHWRRNPFSTPGLRVAEHPPASPESHWRVTEWVRTSGDRPSPTACRISSRISRLREPSASSSS